MALPCAAAMPANPEDIELDDAEEEQEDPAELQGIQLEQKAVPVSKGSIVMCLPNAVAWGSLASLSSQPRSWCLPGHRRRCLAAWVAGSSWGPWTA